MRLLIGLVRLLGLALAFAAFGCFAPGDPPACGLRCGPGGLCPDGTSCQDDGYCHLPGSPRCGDAAVVEDGGDPPDAALHDGGGVDAAEDAASTPAVISVFAGPRSTCFVRADKSAWCMGANDVGQLGDGSQIARHVPTRVPGSFRTIRPA